MATILINAFFKSAGVPATGLSPTLDIWNLDTGTLSVNDAAMTEVGGGNYKYNYTSYDTAVNYSFIADGGGGLANSDRYLQTGNDDSQIPVTLATGAITAAVIATDAIDSDAIAASAVTELQTGLSTHSAADVWSVGTRTLTSFGTLVADIWSHATRTLSSFGSLVSDIWAAVSRTITGGTVTTLANDSITADVIAASAITEIQGGLSTLDAAGIRTALGMASANLDTQLNALPTAAENADAIWDEALSGHVIVGSASEFVTIIKKLAKNRVKHSGTTLTLYDDDGTSALYTFQVKDKDGTIIDSSDYATKVPTERTAAA